MRTEFHGLIPFSRALDEQERAWREVHAGGAPVLLGFESHPVITLGVRGRSDRDLTGAGGFEVVKVDRGGQATLHNPGQLVIFPIVEVRGIGVRGWLDLLSEVTAQCLRGFGVEAKWDPCSPGLYTSQGKIVSVGVRIRRGISTHGLAINVCNDLADFGAIHACGVRNARLDRMGQGFEPSSVFAAWLQFFQKHFSEAEDSKPLTIPDFSPKLDPLSS